MTVQTQIQKVTANGNDSATVFSFNPVVIFDTDELVVTKVDANGDETLLSEGSSSTTYSVAAASGSYPSSTGVTGSITYPASGGTPLATGESIVMKRVLTLEQQTDLNNQGGYFPDVLEAQLDKLVMIDLQQEEEIDRALRVPVSDALSGSGLEIPNVDDRKGNFLAFHATTGAPIAATGVSNVAVSAAMEPVVTSATVDAALDLLFAADYNFENSLFVDDGESLVVGHTAAVALAAITGTLQQLGTGDADSSFQIGRWSADASGPRIIFGKSRNAAISSNTIVQDDDVLGQVDFAADDGTDLAHVAAQIRAEIDGTPGANDLPGRLTFWTTADGASSPTERMRITSIGGVLIGETDNSELTGPGIVVNQGGEDSRFIVCKSSDIAHGLTATAETDTYFSGRKSDATLGGIILESIAEDAALSTPFIMYSYGGTASATKSISGGGLFYFYASEHDGAGTQADVAADGNVLAIACRRGGGDNTVFIFDEDGDLHVDGSGTLTTFDDWDDAALLRGLELWRADEEPRLKPMMKPSRFDANRYLKEDLGRTKLIQVVADENWEAGERSLINTGALGRITTGAVWQLHEYLDALIDAVTPTVRTKWRTNCEERGLPLAIFDWPDPVPGATNSRP